MNVAIRYNIDGWQGECVRVNNIRLCAARYGYFILSALFCLLGIVLIAKPMVSGLMLFWVPGILLILFGIIKLSDMFQKAFTGLLSSMLIHLDF